MLSSLETRTLRNIYFIGISQLVVLFLTLLTVTVLTRILTPEDFGIVSIGMVFVALFVSIQDFGIAPAVIQRDARVEESIAVGLTLRWTLALLLFLVMVGISSAVSDFYGNPAITLVLIVLSGSLFIQPIAFSSFVLLNRKLAFSKIAVSTVLQCVTMSAVSIAMAFVGFSYWSIVIGSLSGSVAYVVVLKHYERSAYKPKIDKALMKELMGFGQHLLITTLMGFVIFNVDQLVVGKVLGVAILGVFFVAVRFGRTLGEQISGTVNRVLFPTMARVKDSIEHLKIGYTQSLRMIAIVTIPLSLGISALAPVFVEVVLGEDFEASAVPISILSFQGLLNALITPAANVLISIGKPKYMSMQATVQATLMVIAVYPVALYYGINGVCLLTTLLSLGVFIYFLMIFARMFRLSFKEIAAPLAPPLLSGFLTFVVLVLLVVSSRTSLTLLVGLSLLGAALYFFTLHLLSRGRDVRDMISLVNRSFGRGQ